MKEKDVTELFFVPKAEFDRILGASVKPELKADLFATHCRINVLYMIARAGSGHIGTSFSSVDIVTWLFLNELNLPEASITERGAASSHQNTAVPEEDADVYFSSKGHDVPAKYSVLMACGMLDFELLHQLRRLGGLPGHPDVSIPFMHTNTGSLGMGISKARGMALARKLANRKGHFYVLTGDGELQEGQFWESLQPTANRAMSNITVIVDHNKVQSDTLVLKTSDLGDLEAKLRAFGWYVKRCDGHDFKALSSVLDEFKTINDRPKILIADTIKGKGVSFMEHTATPEGSLYGFHSGAPSDAHYATALQELASKANSLRGKAGLKELELVSAPHPGRKSFDGFERLVGAYSKALVNAAEKRKNLVALDADLLLDTGLIPFKEKFPDRFFESGIAEQDMVSQAGGMALEGALPFVHSFACFLSDRPNEQIFNNATEHTKIIYAGSLAGLLPAMPGHSHQCVRDIAALSAVPNLVCIEPSCEREVELAVDYLAGESKESAYLRLVSIPVDVPFALPSTYELEYGKGIELTAGEDAALISYGPVMLSEAYRAAQMLKEKGIGLKVVNLPWLNRVDEKWLSETISGHRLVITLDNHFIKGGQGEFIASTIAGLGLKSESHNGTGSGKVERVIKLGLTEIPRCGQNDEVLKAHRLDAKSLADQVAAAVEELRAPVRS